MFIFCLSGLLTVILWTYLMAIILETGRLHLIKYIHFIYVICIYLKRIWI
jgi:hypothetical protein